MFTDALIMDKTWEAPGGFLGFSARFARTGIQMYDGSEIDPGGEHTLADGARRFKPGTLYPVDRPAEEVFSNRALASFIAKPLTNDHPSQGVDIDNWRDLTGGVIGETLRDGEYARLSGLMTDKALIADYRAGKKELSGGYSAKLIIGDGVNAKGESYVAKQTEIDGNHVAFVARGRAGSECRVIDAAPCDALPIALEDGAKEAAAWLKKAIALHEKHMNGSAPTTGKEGEKSQMLMMEQMKNALAELEGGGMKSGMKMDCYPFHIHDQEKPVKTMVIDGLTVDMANADTAIATVQTLIAARDAATKQVTDHAATIAAKDRELATKDGEIADLKAKVSDEATLDARADAKADLVTRGKALLGDKMPDVKGKSLADTRRAIVMAAVGDAALADKSDDYIEARFDGLKDAKPTIQPLGNPTTVADAANVRNLIRAQRNAA